MERSPELSSVTERIWSSYSRGDMGAMAARFSSLEDISFIGTDPREAFFSRDEIERYLRAQFVAYPHGFLDSWTSAKPSIDAWVEGSVGWSILLCERISVTAGPTPIRLTFVFHLENDEWKIVQRHSSIGVPNEEMWPEFPFEEFVASMKAEKPELAESSAPDGTITLVFTDIENSTHLNATFGDRAWIDVLRAHNEVIAAATQESGGTVVKNRGDGFMLAFPSARRGANAAVSMQRRMREVFNDPGSPIRVRVGIHVGEVLNEADDLFGTAVNYAARVAAEAEGGQVLVSSLVHDLLASTGEYAFSDSSDAVFKGIDGPQKVYSLTWQSG